MKEWHKKWKAPALVVGIWFCILLTAFTVKDDLFEISKNLAIFSALYQHINDHYVEKVDATTLMEHGIQGMLGQLDPYTEFIPEVSVEDFRVKYIQTQYGGIGAQVLVNKDEHIIIAEIFEGFAAHRYGLCVGDEIVRVDGVVVEGKSVEEVSHLLKGRPGTIVRLAVKRYGNTEKEFAIARDKVIQPNVSYSQMLANGIGYVKLDKFLSGASEEVHQAIANLRKRGELNGLILDLRDNGGGILQEAVRIVNLFVNQGEEVVTQQGKVHGDDFTYITMQKAFMPQLPLAILINGRSASASEIVAGALQDMDRAVVLGNKSFGKGLVQQTYHLPYNNMVKITIAKYYTPSGRCIQALDYKHKDKTGRPLPVEDSLMSAFTTKNGREVYSGNGIFPDVVLQKGETSAVIRALMKQLLIMDYASHYYEQHGHITSPRNFHISDGEYNRFLNYLSARHFSFQHETDDRLAQLKLAAVDEGLITELNTDLQTIQRKIQYSKQQAVTLHRDEIKLQLEKEIVARYYYKKGVYELLESRDSGIVQAHRILEPSNAHFYQAILSGQDTFQVIGKPLLHDTPLQMVTE